MSNSSVMVISDHQEVALVLAQLVAKMLPAPVQVEAPMNVRQASEWLGISQGTIRYMVKTNQIPHCRIGDRVLLYKHKLAEWQGGFTREKITEPDMIRMTPGFKNERPKKAKTAAKSAR